MACDDISEDNASDVPSVYQDEMEHARLTDFTSILSGIRRPTFCLSSFDCVGKYLGYHDQNRTGHGIRNCRRDLKSSEKSTTNEAYITTGFLGSDERKSTSDIERIVRREIVFVT